MQGIMSMIFFSYSLSKKKGLAEKTLHVLDYWLTV
jgi:hypothetical protein